tara:strand:+ start:624 stop:926 length:303 start_codon:yes stop_codon:yes gene_type:complete
MKTYLIIYSTLNKEKNKYIFLSFTKNDKYFNYHSNNWEVSDDSIEGEFDYKLNIEKLNLDKNLIQEIKEKYEEYKNIFDGNEKIIIIENFNSSPQIGIKN